MPDRVARLDAGRTLEWGAPTAEHEGLAIYPTSHIGEVPSLAADVVGRLGLSASTPRYLLWVGRDGDAASVRH